MEKVINGKVYKQVKISKMVINGKEKEGSIISSEDTTSGNDTTVTIFTEDMDEKNNEQ
ncbi:hypothetical protein ACJDU8_19385 [Clostridium sp. WILCCON 0269]|uniref:Uncharacterized protein n=1 Tax=Candidatus Clostridium eludens TaxID=3381663 RepID=A0ABW8SNQ5_9CLOT